MASSIHLDEGVSPDPNHSPGIVGDDEYLIREMCDPGHFDENGAITPAAISLKHLISEGVSVHRRQHTSIEFIKNSVRNRCRDRQGWEEYVSLIKVAEVRAIKDEGRQAFRVIDDPIADNPGHANIYASRSENGPISSGHARKLRKYLLPLLQNRMSVEAAFQFS